MIGFFSLHAVAMLFANSPTAIRSNFGFSIATSGAEAPCGKSGLYALDTGACAASGAARFFGMKKL